MPITNADRLLSLIRERPGLTERELAQSRFGEGAPQQKVNQDCTLLLSRGLVERRGKGGYHDPYRYHAAKSHLEPTCRQKVKEALELYREEVNAADLKPKTKQTYMRHAETFVRWLHGDFVPGRGNRFGSFILACLVAISVMAPAMPSVAGSAEDAARIEMKFEIRKLAKEIFDRANARAEAAAEELPP
ncbi:MAG: hypothetical protein F4Z55_03290 [Boseongicola sp. SB0667_bin_21]|nr:hypothetical protein [Boseongicola sp. SB0667_bin_21]